MKDPNSEATPPNTAGNSSQVDFDPTWLSVPAIRELLEGKRLHRPNACTSEELAGLGLCGDAHEIWLPDNVRAIDLSRLRSTLNASAMRLWPHLEIQPAIASTSSALMAVGAEAAGRLLVTEYQFGGRGRRGNRWLSPVGQNLCFSFGMRIPGSIDRLGGLSLVVGLAVADALISAEVPGIQLKWPNDLIVMPGEGPYAKLGGILVELQAHSGFCVAVVGIGLNHGGAAVSRGGLDVALADIAELRPGIDRTDVLAAVANALSDYLENFLESGFAPMKSAWQALHAFHDRDVIISSGAQGRGSRREGRVIGVSDTGRLVVRTAAAESIELDAGEVSLRPLGNDSSASDSEAKNG